MTMANWHLQDDYDVRFEWGAAGTSALAGRTRAVAVVDVLRFTTAVEAAVSRGAVVYPFRWHDASAAAFARSVGAALADEAASRAAGADAFLVKPVSPRALATALLEATRRAAAAT